MMLCLPTVAADKEVISRVGGGTFLIAGAILVVLAWWRLTELRDRMPSDSDRDELARRKMAGYGLAIGWGIGAMIGGVVWLLIAGSV